MRSLSVDRDRDGQFLVETSAPVVCTCLSADKLVPWQACTPGCQALDGGRSRYTAAVAMATIYRAQTPHSSPVKQVTLSGKNKLASRVSSCFGFLRFPV